MDRFVIIVNGWKLLTINKKRPILDVAVALDPLLMYMLKVSSDHTKNVKLYIYLAPCSHHEIIVKCNLVPDVFISHYFCLCNTLNSQYKYSRPFVRPRLLPYAQNLQWVQHFIFPDGKHIFSFKFFLQIWGNGLSHSLCLKCEQLYFM